MMLNAADVWFQSVPTPSLDKALFFSCLHKAQTRLCYASLNSNYLWVVACHQYLGQRSARVRDMGQCGVHARLRLQWRKGGKHAARVAAKDRHVCGGQAAPRCFQQRFPTGWIIKGGPRPREQGEFAPEGEATLQNAQFKFTYISVGTD